jgi:hypothetical protein
MVKIGYMHSRFGPAKERQIEVWKQILEECDEIWLGIANPLREMCKKWPDFPKDLKQDLVRARDSKNNPYSYRERVELIYKKLKELNVDITRVKILPHFGYYEQDKWKDFMPPKKESVIYVLSEYPHHDHKIKVYKKEGWKVKVIKP